MKIEAAAINYGETTYSLPRPARHHTIIAYLVKEKLQPPPILGEQGFVTDNGLFVDRIAAGVIAVEAGQIEKLKWPPKLYSEDLW